MQNLCPFLVLRRYDWDKSQAIFFLMYIFKKSNTPFLGKVVSVLVLAYLAFYGPSLAFAQPSLLCVIDGALSANFKNTSVYEVDNELFTNVVVRNDSPYVLSGAHVGIGLYGSDSAVVPAYWITLADTIQLEPNSQVTVPIKADLSALPTGEYKAGVTVFQGDEMAVFGSALREGGVVKDITIDKVGEQEAPVTTTLTINDVASTGQILTIEPREPISVAITTTNDTAIPFTGVFVSAAILQGTVPLGTAVRSADTDELRLAPGRDRVTTLEDRSVEDGVYTVYAFIMEDQVAHPVVFGGVQAGEDSSSASWMYVSQLAVTDFPLQADSDVLACVQYIGEYGDSVQLHETAGVQFTLTDTDGTTLYEETVDNQNGNMQQSFIASPAISATDFTLSATLRKAEFIGGGFGAPDDEAAAVEETRFTDAQLITTEFNCDDSEVLCQRTDVTAGSDMPAGPGDTNSFWFYAGIALAASLLMYLLLRRLAPHEDETESQMQSEELQ